jgi:uridine kinase
MTGSPHPPRPLFIGVAGGSGSGKTTVVRKLTERVDADGVSLVHHDSYYRDFGALSPEERAAVNFDHPDALETELLVRHLDTLASGSPIEVPIYDFRTHTRSPATRTVRPHPVVILDGILILAEPELRKWMDIKVYVDTDADLRFIRRLRRDVEDRGRTAESVIAQYLRTVRPMHLDFVEPSKRWADLILPEGGYNEVAVDMLVAKVHQVLEARKGRPPGVA